MIFILKALKIKSGVWIDLPIIFKSHFFDLDSIATS